MGANLIKKFFNLNTGYFIKIHNYYYNGILENGHIICKGYILFGLFGYDRIEIHIDKKEAEEAPAAEAAAPKTEEDFNAMTVKDLKAYAQEKGIAIESKAKKAEIIDTIMAAEKE